MTLDNPECDDYRMVSHAHMTQTATNTTASGVFNHYGKIPHKFVPSVVVISPTLVGQAPVCQRPWTNLSVVRAAHVLNGTSPQLPIPVAQDQTRISSTSAHRAKITFEAILADSDNVRRAFKAF